MDDYTPTTANFDLCQGDDKTFTVVLDQATDLTAFTIQVALQPMMPARTVWRQSTLPPGWPGDYWPDSIGIGRHLPCAAKYSRPFGVPADVFFKTMTGEDDSGSGEGSGPEPDSEPSVVITDARRGIFTFAVDADDTASMQPGTMLFWQANRVDAGFRTSLASGYIYISPVYQVPTA